MDSSDESDHGGNGYAHAADASFAAPDCRSPSFFEPTGSMIAL